MLVRIKDTNKTVKMQVIDPKTGMDWTRDFIFNAIDKDQYDEPTDEDEGNYIDCVMSQEDADWWVEHCRKYQKADDMLHELRQSIKDNDEYGDCQGFDEAYHQYINGYDFNSQPDAMVAFCENWKS